MRLSKLFRPRHTTLKQDIIESAGIGITLTVTSYLVGATFGWITLGSLNWLEVFAVFTSYSCTYLCVRERRINYPLGVISSAAYALLFLQNGLLASAILNAYLVPTLVYGWFRWRKDSNTRPVMHVSLKMLPIYIIVSLVGYGGAVLVSQAFGGVMAWSDGIILIGSILAQFLLDNKKVETWIVWALVNVFAIYTYATSGLPLVAFQYVFFLANTLYGYLTWKGNITHEIIRTSDGDAADTGTSTPSTIRS